MTEIYLDNNATTPVLPEVRQAILAALDADFGNPSSVHSRGQLARQLLSKSRQSLARMAGVEEEQVLFTSSGTESNNLVLLSHFTEQGFKGKFVTSSIEHSSIDQCCKYMESKGVDVVQLPSDDSGAVNIDRLPDLLSDEVTLVSLQWVNNETGVLQPVETVSRLCQERGIPFHSDVAQAFGKMDCGRLLDLCDFATGTGHKFNGPPGVGFVLAKELQILNPTLFGGGQEGGLRPGTENLPGIIGMAKAAALRHLRLNEVVEHLTELRDRFESNILGSGVPHQVNGGNAHRVCNTSNIRFVEVDGQALVARLDQVGIRCSQSSACTNMIPEPSHVLTAMGLSEEEAFGSVRFSFGVENTADEVDAAAEAVCELASALREV